MLIRKKKTKNMGGHKEQKEQIKKDLKNKNLFIDGFYKKRMNELIKDYSANLQTS